MKLNLKRTLPVVLGLSVTLSLGAPGIAYAKKTYNKTPKEIMYLKGLQQTYGKSGKTYNLYDIDQDETPELFVATKKSKKDTVSIWFYDKKSNSAKKIKTYKNVTEIYTKASKKRVVLVQKKDKEITFSELKVTKKTLSAPVIVKVDIKKGKPVYIKNNKKITKKSYNKYKKSLKDVLVLRDSHLWLPSNTYGIADLFKR